MKRSYCWMLYWALLLLLASLATAAGTTESVPAWRTGPVDFKKAERVPAYYCENQGAAPGPGSFAGYEQLLLPASYWQTLTLVRTDFRSPGNPNTSRYLVFTYLLRNHTLKTLICFDLSGHTPTPTPNRSWSGKPPLRFWFLGLQ